MKIRLNSKGDTIVEVLIVMVILATVIVGAFVSANRSQNSSQASQERAEAIKIAESQIERLKSLLISTASPTIPTNSFCIKDDNSTELIGSPSNPFGESLEAATMPYLQTSGAVGACGNKQGRYNVAMLKGSNDTYSFLVRWERAGGGRDQINMYYRAY